MPAPSKTPRAKCGTPTPTTTLRYYVKVIPEDQHKAVTDLERSVKKKEAKRRSKADPNR
jgi:hypothetical protein